MTDEQLKEMQAKLDLILGAAAALHAMLQHIKDPVNVPSPFSGGGPGPK
jgi:hypothetical protein